jgi:hypothetical protein
MDSNHRVNAMTMEKGVMMERQNTSSRHFALVVARCLEGVRCILYVEPLSRSLCNWLKLIQHLYERTPSLSLQLSTTVLRSRVLSLRTLPASSTVARALYVKLEREKTENPSRNACRKAEIMHRRLCTGRFPDFIAQHFIS